jgi:hypothetical protein
MALGIRKLEALFASLITIMAIAFGIEYCISAPDQVYIRNNLFFISYFLLF